MLFDRYLVVDWSANSTPKLGADSIWVGCSDGDETTSTNLATRSSATAHVDRLLDRFRAGRVLLAVDVSLGYPRGTAAALGFEGPAWAATWRTLAERIVDDDRNANNRFAVAADLNARLGDGPGPFWGCPPGAASAHLTATKPARSELPERRIVEEELVAAGRRPHTSWQLLGAGSVGSQSLLAIPRLEALRRCRGERIRVWPFTTGLTAPPVSPGDVVVAEVWPSMVPMVDDDGRVRDQMQVEETARWLASLDAADRLAELFAPALHDDTRRAVVDEEGWVLGAEVSRA